MIKLSDSAVINIAKDLNKWQTMKTIADRLCPKILAYRHGVATEAVYKLRAKGYSLKKKRKLLPAAQAEIAIYLRTRERILSDAKQYSPMALSKKHGVSYFHVTQIMKGEMRQEPLTTALGWSNITNDPARLANNGEADLENAETHKRAG